MDISVETVPLFFDHREVETTIHNIQKFLTTQQSLSIEYEIRTNFYREEIVEYEPTTEEVAKINYLISLHGHRFYYYLLNHPHICHAARSRVIEPNFFDQHADFGEIITIAVYSGSLQLLQRTIEGSLNGGLYKFHPRITKQLIHYSDSYVAGEKLFFDPNQVSLLINVPTSELCCTTSFAASPSQVFIGQRGGVIRIFSKTMGGYTQTNLKIWASVTQEKYSLCWQGGFLWMFTESKAYRIDTFEDLVIEIKGKPKAITPPVVTDGNLFYSMKYQNHKAKICVFTFQTNQFHLQQNLTIRGSTPEANMEYDTPVIVDGSRISFFINRGRHRSFAEFSLSTGHYLSESSYTTDNNIIAWTSQCYTSEQFILCDDILMVSNVIYRFPPFFMGISAPNISQIATVSDILKLFAFTGAIPFKSGNPESLLIFFIDKEDEEGIFGVCWMLLFMKTNFQRIHELLMRIFNQFRNNSHLRQLCLFMFLALKDESVVELPNVVSSYLEMGFISDIIFYFYDKMDLTKLKLSHKALNILIAYCVHKWLVFPSQVTAIVANCCTQFIKPSLEADNFQICGKSLLYIIQAIGKFVNHPDFTKLVYCDPILDILVFIIQIVRNNIDSWYHRFSEYLVHSEALFVKLLEQNTETQHYTEVLDFALFFLLETIFRQPNSITTYFTRLSDVYMEYSSPLDGVSKSIDATVFKLLSNSTGIESKGDFSAKFNEIRALVLSEPEILERLNSLDTELTADASSLIKFLKTNDRSSIIQGVSPHVIEWTVTMCQKHYTHFLKRQEIIFLLYRDQFEHTIGYFTRLDPHILRNFLSLFSTPVIFPPEIILHSKLKIDAKQFLNFPLSVMQSYFLEFSNLFPQIQHTEVFFDNIGQLEKTGEEFYTRLMLILMVARDTTKFRAVQFYPCFAETLQFAEPSIVRVLMDILVTFCDYGSKHLTKYFTLCIRLINEFLGDNRSHFFLQSGIFQRYESLYIVIEAMKRLFNSRRSLFRHFVAKAIPMLKDNTKMAFYAFLNNQIEYCREGAMCHYTCSEDLHHTKIISSFDSSSFTIFFVDDASIIVSECNSLYIEPIVKVNFGLITDSSVYQPLFESLDPSNVFQQACLYEFSRLNGFHVDIPYQQCLWLPNRFIFDYQLLQCVMNNKVPLFQFSSAFTCNKMVAVSNITMNTQEDTLYLLPNTSGYLIATNSGKKYVSSPIFSSTEAFIKLKNQSSKECFTKLLFFCPCYRRFFQTHKCSLGNIHIEPKSQRVYIGDTKYVYPKATQMIIVNIYLESNTVVSWKYQSHVSFERESIGEGYLPMTTSFNKKLIEGKQFYKDQQAFLNLTLSQSFMFLSAINLDHLKLSISTVCDYMAVIDPNPLSHELSIGNIDLYSHFNIVSLHFMKKIGFDESKRDELIEYINSSIHKYNEQIVGLWNVSALTLESAANLFVSRSFVCTVDEIKLIKETEIINITASTTIVPISDVRHTIFEILVHIRHILMLCLYSGVQFIPIKVPKLLEQFTLPFEEAFVTNSPSLLLLEAVRSSNAHLTLYRILSDYCGQVIKTPNFESKTNSLLITANGDTDIVVGGKSISLQSGMFITVEPNQLLTSITRPLKISILPPNFEESFEKWKPLHSHQLFVLNSHTITEEMYKTLPLSSVFSFSFVSFIWPILQMPVGFNLLGIKQHFITNIKIHQPILPITQREIVEFSRSGSLHPARSFFLASLGLIEPALLDPSFVRVSLESHLYDQMRDLFLSTIERSLVPLNGEEVPDLLEQVVCGMNTFVLLQFTEFCTGLWGLDSLSDIKIYVLCKNQDGYLEAFPNERVLCIGTFASVEHLRCVLLKRIQRTSDMVYTLNV